MIVTVEQLKTAVASYVDSNKLCQKGFTASTDNTAQLIDKIAKTYTLDGRFVDKLSMLDKEDLPLGKTLEEWYQDLAPVTDFDKTGSTDGEYEEPTYRPNVYHYTLGRKKSKISVRYDDFERAANTTGEYAELVTMNTKRMYDGYHAFMFSAKKELLGKYALAAVNAKAASTVFAVSTAYAKGAYLKESASSDVRGVVMQAIPATNAKTWAQLVEEGTIVPLNLVTTLTKPTDTASGEDFIKSVKEKVEDAQFINGGNCLSGATIGVAESGLILLINKSIKPTLEVDVQAGAFNGDKVALPSELVWLDSFGKTADAQGIYAMLIDRRGAATHKDYRAVRSRINADGDFINYVMHFEDTFAYSPNTFLHVWKAE